MIERIFSSMRGGSWSNLREFLRASLLNCFVPVDQDYRVGFRLVVRIKDE